MANKLQRLLEGKVTTRPGFPTKKKKKQSTIKTTSGNVPTPGPIKSMKKKKKSY